MAEERSENDKMGVFILATLFHAARLGGAQRSQRDANGSVLPPAEVLPKDSLDAAEAFATEAKARGVFPADLANDPAPAPAPAL